jgi:3-oxoacyl-[acyl-carrier protein] reductase
LKVRNDVNNSTIDAVAIVTCGSCGIGREVARELGRRGCAVAVVYLDDQRTADAAVDEILAAGGAAVAVRADLADDLDVERLFSETAAVFGCVDVIAHTTARSLPVITRHAAQHLGHGAAIVSVGVAEGLTPAIAEQLRERDIAIESVPPEVDHVVAHLLSLLQDRGQDPWVHGRDAAG